ncbi:hypothetical protein QQ045_002392 [Rhodiola kirilowii]
MNQPTSSHCQFHPMEVFVGVCPFCLSERLLTLASLKQRHYNKHRSQQHCNRSIRGGHNFSLTAKILAISSLWNRLELRVHKTCSHDDFCDYNSGSCSSQEDSFISIKFEENGVAIWDKDNTSDNNQITTNESSDIYKSNNTTVIGHTRQRGGALRWRKRIGHIFDLIRWRNNTASNTNMVC